MTEQEKAMWEAIGFHSGNEDVSMYETPRLAIFGELVWQAALDWAATGQEPVAKVSQKALDVVRSGKSIHAWIDPVAGGLERATIPLYTHPAPPQDAESLGDDLAGVIAEMEAGQPFDKVCLQTLTRVRDSLYLMSRGKE